MVGHPGDYSSCRGFVGVGEEKGQFVPGVASPQVGSAHGLGKHVNGMVEAVVIWRVEVGCVHGEDDEGEGRPSAVGAISLFDEAFQELWLGVDHWAK